LGASPSAPLRELTVFHRPPAGFRRARPWERDRVKGGEKGKERERKIKGMGKGN